MQGLVNENIINAKKTIANDKQIKIAEDRLAEINKNHEKEYAAYTEVFKILLYICIPLLTLHVLQTYGILSKNIAQVLFLVTFFIGLYYFIIKVHSISNRNNMNFDATDHLIYDFDFDTSSSSENILEYDKNQFVKFKDAIVSGAQSAYNMSKNEYETQKKSIMQEYGDSDTNNNSNDSNSGGSGGPITLPTAAGGPS